MTELVQDPVFQTLPSEKLVELAHLVSLKPTTCEAISRSVNSLPLDERLRWFDSHRKEIEDAVCRVGSWTFGDLRTYAQVVRAAAKKLKVRHSPLADTPAIERAIIAKLWNSVVGKLTPEQIEELKSRASEVAAQNGKNLSSELIGFGALSAAQLSGFGVYLLGSTLLGAVNGALGLGLSFGAFTGLSSALSAIIGPGGWTVLGIATLFKLSSPNYRRKRPVLPWEKMAIAVCAAILRSARAGRW
jgi:uncharacterized protein YaaW (UPF0174 family)